MKIKVRNWKKGESFQSSEISSSDPDFKLDSWEGVFEHDSQFSIHINPAKNKYQVRPYNGKVNENSKWMDMNPTVEKLLDESVKEFEWDFNDKKINAESYRSLG